MGKRKRVEGYNHLYRNEEGAIVNTDMSAFQAYKAKRAASFTREVQYQDVERSLAETRAEIDELKLLIKQMLNK